VIRVGLLSAAHVHAGSYADSLNALPNVELVGVWDDDTARGKAAANGWNTAFYPDLEVLLSANLNAVVITAENVNHATLTRAAAAHGLAVMCEKPLALSVEDGEAMISACSDAGVSLMTAFPCRFSPVAQRLKATIESGSIGKVLAIKGTNRGRNPGLWFNDLAKSGGGAVIDHTVHVADLIHWLTGDKAATVFAEIDNSFHHKDFDDAGTMMIRYESGMFATIDCSWSRPKSYPTWGDVTLEIIGEKGSVYGDLFAQHFRVYSEEAGRMDQAPWCDNIDLAMVKAFVEAVETGAPMPVTGEDGLAAVKVAFGAYASAKAGAAAPAA
jgi:predicted dehydrogenase